MNRKQLARVSHVSWEPHMITCHELYNAISGMWRHWEWDVMCNEAITPCVASRGWHSIRAEWSPATHLKLNVMIEWWVHYLLLFTQNERTNVFNLMDWWPLVDLDSCRFFSQFKDLPNVNVKCNFPGCIPDVCPPWGNAPRANTNHLAIPSSPGLSWAEGCWAPDNLITTLCKLLQVSTFEISSANRP